MINKTPIHRTLRIYNIHLIIAAVAHCTRCEPADTPYDHIGLRPVKPIPKEIGMPLPRDGNGGSLPGSGNGKSGLHPVDDPLSDPGGSGSTGGSNDRNAGGVKNPGSGGSAGDPKGDLPGKGPGSGEEGDPGMSDPKLVAEPGEEGDPSTEPRTGAAAPVNEAVRKELRPAESPVSGKEMTLEATYRPVNYRREDFVVDHHHYYCAESGQSFTNKELDAINQDAAAERYRAKYRIPSAEEIRKIREGHGLSTEAMATLLGISNSTFRRYETGSIPQLSTARLIQLAASRENLEVLAELADIDIGVHMEVLEE